MGVGFLSGAVVRLALGAGVVPAARRVPRAGPGPAPRAPSAWTVDTAVGGAPSTERLSRECGGVLDVGVTDRDSRAGGCVRGVMRMAGRNDPEGGHRGIRDGFRAEIGEFLGIRRAKVTPGQAGLPAYGGERRRVTGLRREEVALPAGISSEYYTRLERGNATGVFESVIEGIARALQLDGAERIRLLDLLRGAAAARPPPGPAARAARGAARPGPDGRHTRVRPQRTRGHPGRRPPRARPVLPPSTPTRNGRRTTPGSSSSARTRASSSATGTKPRATRSRCCAPGPAAISATGGFRT